jgi:hypothetical protein
MRHGPSGGSGLACVVPAYGRKVDRCRRGVEEDAAGALGDSADLDHGGESARGEDAIEDARGDREEEFVVFAVGAGFEDLARWGRAFGMQRDEGRVEFDADL